MKQIFYKFTYFFMVVAAPEENTGPLLFHLRTTRIDKDWGEFPDFWCETSSFIFDA